MQRFDYTVTTEKTVAEAVAAVESASTQQGFRVLYTHNVAATLAEKGFEREPLQIVEVCNAKYASQVLAKDVMIALMLPCPISVYRADGQTRISTMLPTVLSRFYPEAGIEGVAAEVEQALVGIVDTAR